MNNNNINDNITNNQENQNINPQVVINAQYVKDLSFESPNAPVNLTLIKSQPAIELGLELNAKALYENNYEVSMLIKAKASIKEESGEIKTLFMVDLEYAGLFTVENVPADDHKEFILLVQCPSIIFPFARRIIADTTRDGGFQPLMIDPVDFVTLYNHKKQQEAAAKNEGDSDDVPSLTGMPNYN